MDLTQSLDDLLVVVIVAAVAPLVAGLVPGRRLPQVVVLIVGGILVGPYALDIADTDALVLLSNVGLGFLFLLAGYELDLELFRQEAGRLAAIGWGSRLPSRWWSPAPWLPSASCTPSCRSPLGLTTTALGTLLPILRENDMLGGRLGPDILAAGAVRRVPARSWGSPSSSGRTASSRGCSRCWRWVCSRRW